MMALFSYFDITDPCLQLTFQTLFGGEPHYYLMAPFLSLPSPGASLFRIFLCWSCRCLFVPHQATRTITHPGSQGCPQPQDEVPATQSSRHFPLTRFAPVVTRQDSVVEYVLDDDLDHTLDILEGQLEELGSHRC